MNEFMDFRLVIADPSLYRHLRGYAACSLPKCRSPIRHHLFGLNWLAHLLFCEHSADD